jgi:hypothetical protein
VRLIGGGADEGPHSRAIFITTAGESGVSGRDDAFENGSHSTDSGFNKDLTIS